MPYIVVGRNTLNVAGSQRYRGTAREWPTYEEALPETAEYNQMFQTYYERAGESSEVDDVDLAQRFLKSIRRNLNRTEFESIQVERAGEPRRPGTFFGIRPQCWLLQLVAVVGTRQLSVRHRSAATHSSSCGGRAGALSTIAQQKRFVQRDRSCQTMSRLYAGIADRFSWCVGRRRMVLRGRRNLRD